jgi:L-fucose isomerase-like protein
MSPVVRSANKPASRLGVLVIGRKRPGFDQQWNAIMRQRTAAALQRMGYDCIRADLAVIDDDTIIAALAQIRAAGVDALVVLQPSLGNGQLAMTVAQQWPDPIVLWATPERPEGETCSSCSLVAQHLWASVFRLARHPFEIVCGDPDDAALQQSLTRAIDVCRAAARLRTTKLGLIGTHAPGFLAMQADMFALRRQLGVQLHELSLVQFIDRCREIAQADVQCDVEKVQSLNLPMRDVTPDDFALNSRFYLAMKQLIAEERLDALALQCWPELPNFGQWPYLALSRLADEGVAVSMEGDADGALTCHAAQLMNLGSGFITDWLEHDDESIFFWHAGTMPLGMMQQPTLARHFNIVRPLVVDGEMRRDEPVTVARLWRVDDRYHLTAFEGVTIAPKRKITGNIAHVRVHGGAVRRRFVDLCHAGMPHHPVVFYGHHTDAFRRLSRALNIVWTEQ